MSGSIPHAQKESSVIAINVNIVLANKQKELKFTKGFLILMKLNLGGVK